MIRLNKVYTNKRETSINYINLIFMTIMKSILAIGLVLYTSLFSFSQCSKDQLFPFKHLASRFEITKQLMLDDNFHNLKELYNITLDNSIQSSELQVFSNVYRCLNGYENELRFQFEDDKLYNVVVKSFFPPEDLKSCFSNFNQLVKHIEKEYPLKNHLEKVSDGKQIGESIAFWKTEKDKSRDYCKVLNVNYYIEYKLVYDDSKQRFVRSGEIEKCVVEISYLNSVGTKKSMLSDNWEE